MRRFTKSLQEASHKYLNHSKPKPPTTPGRKTDAIFENQSSLFNQDDSKKPGIFSRMAKSAGGVAQKLSNAKGALQQFNQDAENYGTMAAVGARTADQEKETQQNPGNNNSLFNQQQTNQQQTNQQRTNQQQPVRSDIQWNNWARNAWPKIPAEAKKFFGDDMNKFIEYKKQEASLRQQGVNI